MSSSDLRFLGIGVDSVCPGGVLVVEAMVAEAAVQDADPSVNQPGHVLTTEIEVSVEESAHRKAAHQPVSTTGQVPLVDDGGVGDDVAQ